MGSKLNSYVAKKKKLLWIFVVVKLALQKHLVRDESAFLELKNNDT